MKVFVTGATGLLGKALIKTLHEHGHETRALVHATAIDRNDELIKTEIVWGDIRNENEHADYLKGCDAVVHCAWNFLRTVDVNDYQESNIDPAIALLHSAHNQGISRFITISSVSVYGLEPKTDTKPFLEDDAFCSYDDAMDVYPRAKQTCETQLTKASTALKIPLTIIRPGLLYSDQVAPVKKAIGNRIGLVAGMGNNHLPYIHVDSVSELIVKVLESNSGKDDEVEIINAVPANNDTCRAVFLRWKKLNNSKAKTIYLPTPMFKLLGLAPYLIKKALGNNPTRPNVEYQTKTGTRNVGYSSSLANEKYDWVGY